MFNQVWREEQEKDNSFYSPQVGGVDVFGFTGQIQV